MATSWSLTQEAAGSNNPFNYKYLLVQNSVNLMETNRENSNDFYSPFSTKFRNKD